MVKPTIIVAAAAIFSANSIAAGMNTEIRQYITNVTRTAPDQSAARLKTEVAGYEVRENLSNFLPQVSYTYVDSRTDQLVVFTSQQLVDGNETSFDNTESYWTVSQTLLDVPKMWELQGAKVGKQRASAEAASTELGFKTDALQLYFEGQNALERVHSSRVQVEYLSARAEREKAELQAGRVTLSTYSVTLSSLAEAQAELAASKSLFASVQQQFCALNSSINCPEIKPMSLVYPTERLAVDLSEFDDLSVLRNPELVSLDLGVDRALLDTKQAASGFVPTVNFEYERRVDDKGGSEFDGSSQIEKDIYRITAVFRPFDGGRKFATLAKKRAEVEALTAEKQVREREIQSGLRRAIGNARAALAADKSLSDVVRSQQEVVDLARSQVNAGLEPLDKVLEVQAELARLQVAQHRARREFVQAVAAADEAVGKSSLKSLAVLDRLVAVEGAFGAP